MTNAWHLLTMTWRDTYPTICYRDGCVTCQNTRVLRCSTAATGDFVLRFKLCLPHPISSGTCLDLKDVPSFRGFFVSGCSDNQESADVEAADASANGALSSIVQSILRSKPSISFEHLRQQTLQGLQHGGFKQTPILECTLSHHTPLLSGWIKDSALEVAARDKAAESSQGQGKAAPGRSMYPNCSVCSQPPTSISSLSSGTCVSCHLYLCPVHVSLHRKQKATADHSIFSFAEVQDEALIRSRALPGSAAPVAATCSVHGATLELYCLAPTCQRTICTQCAVTAHKEHDWKPVEEVGLPMCLYSACEIM